MAPGSSRAARIGAGFFALAVVYCNVAVLTAPLVPRFGIGSLPVPAPLADAFLIFGVFGYYETTNQEMTIWGLTEKSGAQEAYWKQLPTEDYFPHRRGEQISRVWASKHYRDLDQAGHWAAWQFLGAKILARHNRLHPAEPIREVAFQSMTWPRSIEGYYARREPGATRQYWTVAGTE